TNPGHRRRPRATRRGGIGAGQPPKKIHATLALHALHALHLRHAARNKPPAQPEGDAMNANTGKLLDSFTLLVDGHETAAEIRLVIADNGTEMLHHYEAGRFVLAHPAARCQTCNDLI